MISETKMRSKNKLGEGDLLWFTLLGEVGRLEGHKDP